MILNLLIVLNVGIFFVCSLSLIKQWITTSNYSRLENHLLNLSQQFYANDQQSRENILQKFNQVQEAIIEKLNNHRLEQNEYSAALKEQLQQAFAHHRTRFDERQIEALKLLQESLQKGNADNRQQITEALNNYATFVGNKITDLSKTTEKRLDEINHQVEKRLVDGFVKTNETFNNVIQRLAIIDAAQKKIADLSSNVVSLQQLLNDKRSRGAFGEVQLSALIHNMIPKQHVSFQHLLSNNRRPDCMLFLPEPTGNIAIDAKFPLENYRSMIDVNTSAQEKQQAERQFKIDIRKHITDIAEKYIIPGETADGAVMFIPAEAIFSEIHTRHDDLVEFAQQSKVWLVSPTTMMAILTTARAVLKDAATRKQIHTIQQHLRMLSSDFERFQIRMDNLAKRIAQANADVEQVHISSKKISQRFMQIEQADIEKPEPETEPSLIQGQASHKNEYQTTTK